MSYQLGGETPRRVILVRALRGLGDILCTVPAFRALRIALPDAEITLAGLPEVKKLVARYKGYIDSWLEFPGYPGLAEREPDLVKIPGFFVKAQRRQFDLALQLHGSGQTTNPLTVMLGAKFNAGFYLPGQFCPDEKRFLPFEETESEIRRYLRLLEHLGIASQGEHLEFPLNSADEKALTKIGEIAELKPGDYACIHPGASVPERRWQPGSFAAVGDKLASQGLQVVLTGSAGEAALTQAVSRAMRAKAIDLAGKTELGSLAALLSRARLLVCNDTGVSHLAAALCLPSVVIFSASDPKRWGPLDRERHRVIFKGYGREVSRAAVVSQVEALLREQASRFAA